MIEKVMTDERKPPFGIKSGDPVWFLRGSDVMKGQALGRFRGDDGERCPDNAPWDDRERVDMWAMDIEGHEGSLWYWPIGSVWPRAWLVRGHR